MSKAKTGAGSCRGPCAYPDHILLSFSKDPHTTATVTWRTDTSVAGGYIECRSEDGEIIRAEAVSRFVKSDIAESFVHFATPENLVPGAEYCYTVGNDSSRSKEYSFKTEPERLDKFKFLIISDWQNATPWAEPAYEPVRELLLDALSKHPDCRFILSAGDNSDDGQNEAQWNGVFNGLKGIAESIPIMMSTGNHDNRGYINYAPVPIGKFYIQHADLFDKKFEYTYPDNGAEGYRAETYSFDYGNAHFAVFGINGQETVGEWLFNDLRSSDKLWKIGAYHFPVYPAMPEGVNDDSYPALRKGIESGRLDIVISGHEHALARTYPIKDDQLFDRPSQGTVHFICGNAGKNIHYTSCRKVWHCSYYPQEEPIGVYSVAEVEGAKLTVTAYTTDGRIAEKFIIDKEKDEIQPYALAPIYSRTKMAYKGYMLELIAKEVCCQYRDSVWFAAFGVLVQGIGGKVLKTPHKVDITVYKRHAVFTPGSDIAETDRGEVKLCKATYLYNNQLYIPVCDAAGIFDMQWEYAQRNNYINFNCQTEEKPLI